MEEDDHYTVIDALAREDFKVCVDLFRYGGVQGCAVHAATTGTHDLARACEMLVRSLFRTR
jgi:hypothetical protein